MNKTHNPDIIQNKRIIMITTKELSISQTIAEAQDVIAISKHTLNCMQNLSGEIKKEVEFAVNQLSQAENYLSHIKQKTDIALKFIPDDMKQKNHL